MKLELKLSLLGNLLLVLTCAVLAIRPWRRGEPRNTLAPNSTVTARVSSAPPDDPGVSPRPVGFWWQTLESTDYRTYVANLRAIGCPERTIGDIVQADVHGLFADKRREFGLDTQDASSPWSTSEEGRVIAVLIG